MTYIPISPKERDAMLQTIGVKSLDELFEDLFRQHTPEELEAIKKKYAEERAKRLRPDGASH